MADRIRTETFSPVDATWLRMDTTTNIMMITGVMMFDEPLDVRRLKEVVTHRLLRHERFRQRVEWPALALGRPRWRTDPHFDLDAHIHRVALPQPGDMAALQALVGDLMSLPLDAHKPLWHIYVVENFGSGGAIICRLHHCLADGLALMDVLLSLTDRERDATAALPTDEKPRAGWLAELLKPVTSTVKASVQGAGMVLHEGFTTLLNPSHAEELARKGVDYVAALGKLLLTLPDHRTILRGQCGVIKRATWSNPIPLEDVKVIGHGLDSTVNDVLLAAVSGALGRYLEGRGQATDGLNIRTMVPVSLRKPSEMGKLGNRFGLVILSLPVGVREPLARLAAIKKRMDDIKHTPEAAVAFGILNTIGLTPPELEKIIVDIFASKVSAVMTNVPGPKQKLYLAGSGLSGLMFWVPAASNIGLGISILSYAGEVVVGVMTDAGLVPDPDTIVAGFHSELAAMKEQIRAATRPDSTRNTPVNRCQAVTLAGQPCKNRALPGETRCRVHLNLDGAP